MDQFRKNRSCETQLFETINDLALSLNAGEHTDFILLDFLNAFDKVRSTACLGFLESAFLAI